MLQGVSAQIFISLYGWVYGLAIGTSVQFLLPASSSAGYLRVCSRHTLWCIPVIYEVWAWQWSSSHLETKRLMKVSQTFYVICHCHSCTNAELVIGQSRCCDFLHYCFFFLPDWYFLFDLVSCSMLYIVRTVCAKNRWCVLFQTEKQAILLVLFSLHIMPAPW